MLSTITIVLAATTSLVSAIPTRTARDVPSVTDELTGVTHTVVAGRAGQLIFDPDNVVADIGDVIEWHYLPANHSVVQSTFDAPCLPLSDTSFFSGFFPIKEGQSDEVFQVVVKDDKPIWYYCAQGTHCSSGMLGAINQDFDSDKTLREFKELAKAAGPGVAPPEITGGERIPNPNPNSGV
ncbi:uncharacterized protein DNG_03749 [Cephalotrichum gorgonifer]|uniref:Extracellular serine-rich protein n=1 Tax=Cephalotrichum gorgonifer TaxID=2041049 RepID=A0AAE8MXK4_9PEZI|nr:uncharacterized protein DNG_03749 [Cephalotrichum gorgonifer]